MYLQNKHPKPPQVTTFMEVALTHSSESSHDKSLRAMN